MGDFQNPEHALNHANSIRVPDTPDESSYGDDFSASQVPSQDGEMRHGFATDAREIGNDRPKPLDVSHPGHEANEPEQEDSYWEDYEYEEYGEEDNCRQRHADRPRKTLE